ncbi:uncharacterized protein LOC141902896 isoform X2 [Tubulanus polymorphus]|uniref:uncharacterized protein LOC141902896 isoform X2 n=1 Tax=Tubulanus polymorphus TaxID=672921 RepID=UPI003DA35DA7
MHYKLIIIFVLCGAGISAAPAKRQNPGNNDQSEVADFRRLLNIFVRLLEIALPKKGENGSQSPTATPQRRQDEAKDTSRENDKENDKDSNLREKGDTMNKHENLNLNKSTELTDSTESNATMAVGSNATTQSINKRQESDVKPTQDPTRTTASQDYTTQPNSDDKIGKEKKQNQRWNDLEIYTKTFAKLLKLLIDKKRSDEKGLSEAEMDAWNSFLSSQNEDNEKQEVSEDTIKPDTYTPLESKKKSEVIEEMIKPETYNALGGKKRSEIVEEPIIEQEYAKPLGSDKRDDESDTAARELLELRALQALKRFAELKKN